MSTAVAMVPVAGERRAVNKWMGAGAGSIGAPLEIIRTSIVNAAAPAIGPTLGGYIVTNINWRWIFFVNVPVGIVAVLMCLAFLPADEDRKHAGGSIDWASIATLVIGLGTLQTVLEEGQTDDWFQSPFISIFSVLAVVGLVAFVWRSLTAKQPVVDLRV